MSKKIITPSMAQEILSNNHVHQRQLRRARVLKYAELMREGLWLYNGESIVVSVSGELIDGQHRLSAIVEAGVEVETAYIDDVPDIQDGINTFLTINSENRNNADALFIDGFKEESANIAKLLGYKKAFDLKKLVQKSSGYKYNNIEVVQVAREMTSKKAVAYVRSAKERQFSCDLVSLNFWLMMEVVFDKLPRGTEFMDNLALCEGDENSNPYSEALLKFFRRFVGTGGGANINKVKFIAIFKTYDTFVKNGSMPNLRVSPSTNMIYPAGYIDYEDA